MKTVVILPTYNEAENLARMIEALVPIADVLVVDDNSPDGTGKLGDDIAAANDRVRVLHRLRKEGLGRAYVAGFREALARDYDRIIQMDCDFSHDPADVPRLLAALEGGAGLAIGSRYVPGGGTRNWGLVRRIISRGGSIYARAVLQLPYRDLTSGFKAWSRKTLSSVGLERVEAQGYLFQIEMTARAHRLGEKIAEVPIVFVDRKAGRSKMSTRIAMEAVLRCWRLRRVE